MDNRREFLKKAMLLTGGVALTELLHASILKAMQIEPADGSSFSDAEHVVFLMQENRSFDHMFGSLQGVRGFNDPRSISLPNANKVWLQTNEKGETYRPFHLDINNTKATWMSDLPHSWPDQTDARNHGHFDKWLESKKSPKKEYRHMPLTLGYYNRQDLPFYYALADAFTICDQNFSSALSSTTPNRVHFWSGTVRDRNDPKLFARVWNEDTKPWSLAHWKTFPERLEALQLSWKVYQNDLYKQGLPPEKETWLDNFGDNTLENFGQFNVDAYQKEKYKFLTSEQKSLHDRAFTTNKADPYYRDMQTLTYQDGGQQRELEIPKGDVLHQFRDDVKNGNLPLVSWLVPAGKFSDHPGHPWYGAWFMSEVINILTENPKIWKKTIFVLTYDENDGYFDHIPPYVPPHPHEKNRGKLSASLDAQAEYVTSLDQQSNREKGRIAPIGLGYRVPMIIASPWTRGGWVNSEVFDHTSSLQFLEKFVDNKFGKKTYESNISAWRRAICGDLTSVFRPYEAKKEAPLPFLEKIPLIEKIHKAKFKNEPANFRALSEAEMKDINSNTPIAQMPRQEPGVRPSSALPYSPEVNGRLRDDKQFEMNFHVSDKLFGPQTAASPFIVYTYRVKSGVDNAPRNYAITVGDRQQDVWTIEDFDHDQYHLVVQGPNGFFREFNGAAEWNNFEVSVVHDHQRINRHTKPGVLITVNCPDPKGVSCAIIHHGYGYQNETISLKGKSRPVGLDLSKSFGWYDFTVQVSKGPLSASYRYAGRIETGKSSYTDPLMGRTM
ncbi:phosphocholine-specific phospholipase C [Dyadobacter sp. CY323]|uniref:phosphocholine-specific phospholipase C n=1 Tax=Dyadobacter sp. CY323 TaxID=2907302 RepID=UPI001F198C6C|nr:phospholipase C, phosphocholine-specific [Dyadobacter sp. CY323]MCE6989855.1 phospholipase C, phosphocholine-specific [Dyadobacter sp. CY323]